MRWQATSGWLLLSATLAVGAETGVRIVHIGYIGHEVEASRAPVRGAERGWSAAILNAPIAEGESLRTGAAGEAEVDLECGSALRLAPSSSFDFTRLRLLANGVDSTTVTVAAGTVFFNLRRLDSRDFHVALPSAVPGAVPSPVIDTPYGATQFQVEIPAAPSAAGEMGAIGVSSGRARLEVAGAVYEVKKPSRWVWTAAGKVFRVPPGPDIAAAQWNRARNRQFDLEVLNIRLAAAQAEDQKEAQEEAIGAPAPSSQIGEGQVQDVRGVGITTQLAMGDANQGASAASPVAPAPGAVPDCALF